MSKKVQSDLKDYFGAKNQVNKNDGNTTNTKQSKHFISLDCEIKQMKANEINWTLLFNFDFHFADTSSDQSIVESDEIVSTSTLKVHVEGTVASSSSSIERSQNVEFDVRVGENGEQNPKLGH